MIVGHTNKQDYKRVKLGRRFEIPEVKKILDSVKERKISKFAREVDGWLVSECLYLSTDEFRAKI